MNPCGVVAQGCVESRGSGEFRPALEGAANGRVQRFELLPADPGVGRGGRKGTQAGFSPEAIRKEPVVVGAV